MLFFLNSCTASELRHVNLARNNYLGSHSTWGGGMTVACFSITKSANNNNIPAKEYFKFYFKKMPRGSNTLG